MSFPADCFTMMTTLDLPFDLENKDGTYQIFPTFEGMEDKEYPSLVYEIDYLPDEGTMSGPTGMLTVTLKLSAIGTTPDDAASISDAIVAALDATKGTWGSTTIMGCFFEGREPSYFVGADMETVRYFTDETEFHVVYQTAA
jgi:hypothetical protein